MNLDYSFGGGMHWVTWHKMMIKSGTLIAYVCPCQLSWTTALMATCTIQLNKYNHDKNYFVGISLYVFHLFQNGKYPQEIINSV